MYLPFLRGKLYELKAIKEFAEESYGKDYGRQIMPIIEPVKKDIRSLVSCVQVMGDVGMPFAVVMNSRTGDFQRLTFDIQTFLDTANLTDVNWVQAYEVNSNANIDSIQESISQYNFDNVMLVFFTNVDLDDPDIVRLINNDNVKFVAVLNLTQRPPVINGLKATGKRIITIEDCFPEKSTNNAYRDNLDEFFSDTFSYYDTLFDIYGFSDFTVLSRNFREGGVLPQVVAIHMTYKKSDKAIYVHHFLSDSRNGSNDIRNEFREANDKISPFYLDKPRTIAVEQITNQGYPGLGAIKKFSIKNHLELISRILHEKEE
ncbi:MAG: sce7725 family protein [Candidatus Cryptobacteroides sp.]